MFLTNEERREYGMAIEAGSLAHPTINGLQLTIMKAEKDTREYNEILSDDKTAGRVPPEAYYYFYEEIDPIYYTSKGFLKRHGLDLLDIIEQRLKLTPTFYVHFDKLFNDPNITRTQDGTSSKIIEHDNLFELIDVLNMYAKQVFPLETGFYDKSEFIQHILRLDGTEEEIKRDMHREMISEDFAELTADKENFDQYLAICVEDTPEHLSIDLKPLETA